MSLPLHIALIEDDPEVAKVVREGMDSRLYAIHHAGTWEAGRRMLAGRSFDAVILDLTLPDGNGLDLALELRQNGNDVPLLMLTARNTVQQRLEGFQHGADDYLGKPFAVAELSARLAALLRRAKGSARHRLRYADIELDRITRKVVRGSCAAELSAREAELLVYLIRNPEQTLSRERILEDVWGDEAEDDSNVLNVYINYLRNKIEAGVNPRIIHTIRGIGYMLSREEPEALLEGRSASGQS